MTTDDTEYRGETKPRNPLIAAALTYLCPGLGFIYVGQFMTGLTINLGFLLMLEAFVVAFSVLKFFPLLPFAVFVAAWLVVTTFLAAGVHRRATEAGSEYVLAGYNHWTIYVVVYLLSFVVPIVLTAEFTTQQLWQLDRVQSAAMYPTVQPGDTVLTDLMAFHEAPPARGELVAATAPGSDDTQFLRVVGVHGDVVRMEGNTLYVDDQHIGRTPLQEDEVVGADLDNDSGLLAWVEHNRGHNYVISVSPQVYTELTMPPTKLGSDQYFLLADNRSQVPVDDQPASIRDSRNFGELDGQHLQGRPRYIFWSRAPDGSIRWGRIGLRVR